MNSTTKLLSSIGGNRGLCAFVVVVRGFLLLSGNDGNAAAIRLVLLFLLLCFLAKLLDFCLLKRLQFVVILGRVLSGMNGNSTWRLIIIVMLRLALLLLRPLLIFLNPNLGNLADVRGSVN